MINDSISLTAIELYMKKLFLEARGWKEIAPWYFRFIGKDESFSVEDAFQWEVQKITGIAHQEIGLTSNLKTGKTK